MHVNANASQAKSLRGPTRIELAAHQPEFYLHALRAICIGNSLALLVVAGIAGFFAYSENLVWETVDNFNVLFEFIVLEFFAFNCLLFLLLRYKSWYEKTPREGLNKLRHLTWVVLLWDGVHFLIGFEVFGGFHGPFVILLPIICVLAFQALPVREALIACGTLGTALVTLALAQVTDHVFPLGALGSNFTRVPDSTGAVAAVVLTGTAASVFLGWRLQSWLGATTVGSGALHFLDHRFGCFTEATLKLRSEEESRRVFRNASASAFLLIRVENLVQTMQSSGIDASWDTLQQTQRVIANNTRSDLDTCAYLGNGRFGVLLPTATTAQAEAVAGRIIDAATKIGDLLRLGYGIAEVSGTETAEDDTLSLLYSDAERSYRIPS